MSPEALALGEWYHRIELPDGTVTPGDRDQSLVFALYESLLPDRFDGMRVLDLGANAGGLTLEFARRGAHVTAVDFSPRWLRQADWVLERFDLADRVDLYLGDVFNVVHLDAAFDIVCYVGLSYHVRHPQLAFDLLTRRCRGTLITSSQTITGDGLRMHNRAARHPRPGARRGEGPQGHLLGWEPTEQLFLEMIAAAGFQNPRIVSTSPHPGEAPGRLCGNRTYCIAEAASQPAPLAMFEGVPLEPWTGDTG